MTITPTYIIKLNLVDVTSLVSSCTVPTRKLSSDSSFTFTINDCDFALYNSYINGVDGIKYCNCQFCSVSVQDSETFEYLFIGRVTIPTFYNDQIIFVCESIGKFLEDKTLSSATGVANFIYWEGKITDPSYNANSDQMEVVDLNGDPINLTVDENIGRGLLVNDKTEQVELQYFSETAPYHNDFDITTGNGDNTYAADEVVLKCEEDDVAFGYTTDDLILDLSDVNIPDSNSIISIEFKYKFKITTCTKTNGATNIKLYLGLYNTNLGDYVDILGLPDTYVLQSNPQVAVSKSFQSTYTITSNALNYLVKSGNDYVKFRVRFRFMCSGGSHYFEGYTTNPKLEVDYVQANVIYQSGDFSSKQYEITDNGTNWIESSGEDFEGDSISVDDTFQIGESTTAILQKVFAYAGVDIDIDPTFSKFIARNYKGMTPKDVLNSICLVENAYWWEEYNSDGSYKIMVRKYANFKFNDQVNTVLDESFDLDDWDKIGDGTVGSISITSFNGYTDVMHLNHISVSGELSSSLDLVDCNESCISVEFMFQASEDNDDTCFRCDLNNDDSDLIFKIYTDTGHLKAANGGTITTIVDSAKNIWYKVKLNVDLIKQTMDVYVDDVLCKEDLAIPNAGIPTSLKYWVTGNAEHLYITNLLIRNATISIIDRNSFSIERAANYIKSVRGLGNPVKGIDMFLSDDPVNNNNSPIENCIIDESINTEPDMLEILTEWLANHKTLQPSLKVTLNNINNSEFLCGYIVYLNVTNPTGLAGLYPVRRVDYNYNLVGLKQTILWLGFGQTEDKEHFIENQKKMLDWARKAHLYAQNPSTLVSSLSYNDLTNKPTIPDEITDLLPMPNNTAFTQNNATPTSRQVFKRTAANILELGDGTQNTGLKILEPLDLNSKVVTNLPAASASGHPVRYDEYSTHTHDFSASFLPIAIQISGTFTADICYYWNGSAWAAADNDVVANLDNTVVGYCAATNVLTLFGKVTKASHGYTILVPLYVGADTKMTSSIPTPASNKSMKRMGFAIDSNTLFINGMSESYTT